MTHTRPTRRSFVKAAAVATLGVPIIGRAQITERGLFTERDVPYACDELLRLLNEERRSYGLNALEMDALACKVAAEHARDMATGHFISHWGRDGRKPYQRYSFAGVLRHDASNKDRLAADAGNVCQLFATGFRTRCIDVWQSYEDRARRGEPGPEVGDLLQVVLRRYPYTNELKRVNREKDTSGGHFWALIPYYSKDGTDAPVKAFKNYADGSCGEAYRIGRVAAVYGAPENVALARGIAQKYVWSSAVGSNHPDLLKLCQLEIEVAMT